MTSRKLAAFRLDLAQIAGLEEVKRLTGAPVAEQVRRAIDAWLDAQRVMKVDRRRAERFVWQVGDLVVTKPGTPRKRAATRKRRTR